MVRDFPGGPVIKNSPSNAGGVGSIPGQRSHMPQGPNTKTKNQNQHCNKFNKDLKNGTHTQKNLKKTLIFKKIFLQIIAGF